jgi:hypothetical protein
MARPTFYNRDIRLQVRYGIGEEAYKALEQAQNYGCKICGVDAADQPGGVLDVDHDHKTGRIRGLLCHNCNVLLGHAKENPVILLKAIQYLKGNL